MVAVDAVVKARRHFGVTAMWDGCAGSDLDAIAVMNADEDALRTWVTQQRPRRPQRFIAGPSGLRFAFYGRMSTVDYQDRTSSWRWQYNHASDLIDGQGRIVADYFDEGVPRRVAWPDRPQDIS